MIDFDKPLMPFFRRNSGTLWLLGFILTFFISDDYFFQYHPVSTVVTCFLLIYIIWVLRRATIGLERMKAKGENIFAQNWVTIGRIGFFYLWLFSGSIRPDRPPLIQTIYQLFKVLAAGYLWFNLGFKMGQKTKVPEDADKDLSKEAD